MPRYAAYSAKRKPALRRVCVLYGHACYSTQSMLRTSESCAEKALNCSMVGTETPTSFLGIKMSFETPI
jgi:hypothetical protein